MLHLYLVRHGENPANVTKEFSCLKVDYSLTDKGRLQAEQTAVWFENHPLDVIISSPLRRTRETAQVVADHFNLPVEIMPDFIEVQVGDLEGTPATVAAWKFYTDIVQGWFSGNPEGRFPGGENFFEIRERLNRGLRLIANRYDGRNVMIAGHAGIFSMIMPDWVADFDPQIIVANEFQNCGITEIEIPNPLHSLQGKLIRWSSVEHLSGEAAKLVSPIMR